MSQILMKASREWASRPQDERFVSLPALRDHCARQRERSAGKVIATEALRLAPVAEDNRDELLLLGPKGEPAAPSNHAFQQLCTLAKAPAGYMREMPAQLVADCVNWGLTMRRDVDEIGILLTRPDEGLDGDMLRLRAATGPGYGRIWNAEIAEALIERFGDGVTGDWRVPGEWGRAVDITRENTTFYAGDRDMFVFLADEVNRIEVPNRRNGKHGGMARGFFLWNSEVGATSIGLAMFLYDEVCGNRIVWGAEGYREIRLRHSAGAPMRWLDEITPVLAEYREASTQPIEATIASAKAKRLEDKAAAFMAGRFGKNIGPAMLAQHEREEGRPVETIWDAATAATAYARGVPNQDNRVAIEREAGKLLDLAA